MTISRTIQAHLAKGDFDAVEDEWLTQLGKDAEDLDYFVGVARALIGTGEDERARMLLDMLDGELRQRELWRSRLKLLARAGAIYFDPEKLHPAILATLKRLYGDRPTFTGFVEAAGLNRAVTDIPKTWEKVERLESLVSFDVGSVVAMEGKGVGRVVDVNLGLESFKVDFERHPGLMVGFKAAPKLLKPLSPEHVLWKKLEDPAGLTALAKADPPALLRMTLESYDRPLSASEIREVLAGIVTESGWTSFWGAARKHPQVVAAGGGARQTYRWAESSGDAFEALWKGFANASPRKKIELLRRDAVRDPGLRRRMAEHLVAVGEVAAEKEPGLAFEIWFALERTGGAPAGLAWDPDRTLAGASDLTRILTGIEDRLLRERAYAMLRERRADWTTIYRDMLARETDPRALEVLADGLIQASPKELDRFVDGIMAQPHRQPAAFTWLAERAAVDESLRARNPLRLLQQILTTITRDEFAPYRLRLLALAESGGTVPRLLTHLTEEQAAQAADAVHRAAGLEPYQREQLTNALELRFASLRREAAQAPLYALVESIEAKRAELKQLLSAEIPANRKAIEEARAMGDLRENFEYKSARQRHEYLNARASALNADLSRVRPIETGGLETSEVRLGTRVHLADGTGQDRVMTLLGPWESKPEEDVISYESDLGKELLGKRVGDTVEVGGSAWTVRAIDRYA